jgi:hypothetical protein
MGDVWVGVIEFNDELWSSWVVISDDKTLLAPSISCF